MFRFFSYLVMSSVRFFLYLGLCSYSFSYVVRYVCSSLCVYICLYGIFLYYMIALFRFFLY